MSAIITMATEKLPEGNALSAGGGLVGFLLATVLSHHGVPSVLLERNETTTKRSNKNLTSALAMEIFR
jgi:2-polyprenyl-6-methoxyphenol hydroxylase-like FAD-dependent oxidoreductase